MLLSDRSETGNGHGRQRSEVVAGADINRLTSNHMQSNAIERVHVFGTGNAVIKTGWIRLFPEDLNTPLKTVMDNCHGKGRPKMLQQHGIWISTLVTFHLSRTLTSISVVATLLGIFLLAPPTSASVFYDFQIIALTGQAGLIGMGDNPSINDDGTVAFVGRLVGGEGVFIGDGSSNPISISFVNPQTVFGRAVQITNSHQVVARDSRSVAPPLTFVRVWDATSPGVNRVIARGGSISDPWGSVFSHPGINESGDVVFSALLGTSTFLVTEVPEPLGRIALTIPLRPMIADDGRIVVKAGNQATDPIHLYDYSLATFEVIADSSKFSVLGNSPGISDDGQIVTFYGDLTLGGADVLMTTPGPGIFASIRSGGGRIIQRIAGKANNGYLDPGETFIDTNSNGKFDQGESDVGPFASFDPDSRVGVNSTQSTQRAVTIVYVAFDDLLPAGKKGIYTSRLNFFGTGAGTFDPENLGSFTVSTPALVVKQGDTISGFVGSSVGPLGPVEGLGIHDPVNNRDRRDIAFWVSAGTSQAVIRARPRRWFSSTSIRFLILLRPPTQKCSLKNLASRPLWDGTMAMFFSSLSNRPDLSDANAIHAIQNKIVDKVQ